MKIGLISDTHSWFGDDVNKYLNNVDEIWHAGDIGDISTADKYKSLKPFRAVYGNIDGHEVRIEYPEYNLFKVDDLKILMIHIGGYPGRYSPRARQLIQELKPDIFISGHSHILKIIPDKKNNLLHMNPGACGKRGFQKLRTLILFEINKNNIENVQVVELA
ncbi:MAG: metallophosphoesterase family protein [Saprospiraceae bacterium]